MLHFYIDQEQRDFIHQSITRGEYELTLELLDKFEKNRQLTNNDVLFLLQYKSRILITLGHYHMGLEVAKEALKRSELDNNLCYEIDSISNIISALYHLGNINESKTYLAKYEKKMNSLTDSKELTLKKAKLYLQKGKLLHLTGNQEEAIVFLDKSHEIYSKMGSKFDLAEVVNNQGLAYEALGNLDKSMMLYALSLALYQEIENHYKIANLLNNLGEICRQKGFLGQGLRHFQQCLAIWEDIGNKESIALSLSNIGTIYYNMGDFRKARSNFELSMELFSEIGNFMNLAENLYRQILLHLQYDYVNEAEKYFKKLSVINEQHQHKPTNQLYRMADALILKKTNRLRNMVKATFIFEEIVVEKIVNYEIMVEALLNLCELYLAEFKLTNEEETFDDLELAVKTLLEIADAQKSQKIFATTYWLKAHISLIKLDIDEAKMLLAKAQKIAEDIGLQNIAIKISNDYDQFLSKSDDWNKLKATNASISERLELSQVDELVNDLLQQGVTSINDLPAEEPVFITILDKSGSSVFSKEFSNVNQIDDQLMGGFLTALNSFVGEAFASSGGYIDRIKFKDYTFVIKQFGNLVFCYIFKGYSYYAVQKLEDFIGKVKGYPKIIQKLAYFAQTGMLPDKEYISNLDDIVADIFS